MEISEKLYRMKSLDNSLVNLQEVYIYLIVEWFIMMILWIYLEQVVPSTWGVKKHPLFFLGYGKHKNSQKIPENSQENLPDDVLNEKNRVFDENCKDPIRVLNLRKVYQDPDGGVPKVAVKGVSFGVSENSCLGVLGHNGAGKTTSIHMLIGLLNPSGGTAYIAGNNLQDDISTIHTIMGVCPQHDSKFFIYFFGIL